MSTNIKLAALLMDLEAALRKLSCWDEEKPIYQALESQEPFCVDTLEFYQWLQWIFIPRMYSMLAMNHDLPNKCDMASMAEEWAKTRAFSARELILVLQEIDVLLSEC
jgi:uncharacterized protein YqcC (DUF446 family)